MSKRWPEGPTELCKELWDEGWSCSQIADRINLEFRLGKTRNSVIGKVHRLGLPGRMTTRRKTRQRTPAPKAPPKPEPSRTTADRDRRAALPAKPGPASASPIEPETPVGERKSIIALTATQCRWPIGDPREAGFHFCGAQRQLGKPYCRSHCIIAFQPVPIRRRARLQAAE